MPVISRQLLRQHLGQRKLRDTYVGVSTTGGISNGLIDAFVADPTLVNDGLYQRTWLYVNGMELRVASFNCFSGAYLTGMNITGTIGVGSTYEHHRKVRPSEKDRQLDGIIERLWTRQEIPINTVAGLLNYSIGQGFKIFGAYYFASPSGSLSRDRHELWSGWNIVTTGSGRELRLPENSGGLSASQQIILDAQVRLSLAPDDTSTVDVPDEDWVLNGAAARCYQSLIADAPGQEAGKYQVLAQQFAAQFIKGIGAYREQIDSDWRSAFSEYVF